MLVSIAMLLLLAAAALGVAGSARWLGRRIPGWALAVFLVVSVSPFPRAYVSDLSVLPLDHALYVHPWARGAQPPFNPFLNDVATEILPWAKETRLAFKEGSLPLYNRWNGCGMPLAANGVSAALSPLTLLGFLLPLARGFTLLSSIRLLLAAAGMWLWVRELGVSERSATFAAVVFGLSFSFTPPWLMFPHSAVICVWPATLFLLERARDPDRRLRAGAALTLLLAVTVLLGHSETAAIGFLFMGLWLAARWLVGDRKEARAVFATLAAAAALAMALTAFLLLPSLHAIAGSGRLAEAQRPYWQPLLSAAPHAPLMRQLPTALFPHAVGDGIASPMLPFVGGSFPEMTLGYFGLVGWVAAFLILRPGSRRARAEWILVALLLCGWGFAVGLWPLAELFSHTPVLRYLFPLRFHSWEALAGPAIAAFELDRLGRDSQSRSPAGIGRLSVVVAPAVLAVLAVATFFAFRAEHAIAGALAFQTRRLLIALAVLAVAAVLLAAAARGRNPRVALAFTGLTLLAGLELLYQWRGLFRLSSPAALFPETPLVAFLRAQSAPFRVAGEGPVLFPNTNVFAGVEDIRTHDAVERRDYLAFLDATCGYHYEYFKILRNLDAAALDFLNVRYLLKGPEGTAPGPRWRLAYDGEDGKVFENTRVLPRVFAPERVRLVRATGNPDGPVADANALFGAAMRDVLSNADWKKTAWILGGEPGDAGNGAGEDASNSSAEISDYRQRTNTIEFTVKAPATAWVVLSVVQDGGWTVRAAPGEAIALSRANGPFLALRVPAGDRRVRLRYLPPGFVPGLWIAGLGALASVGIGARLRRAAPAEGRERHRMT